MKKTLLIIGLTVTFLTILLLMALPLPFHHLLIDLVLDQYEITPELHLLFNIMLWIHGATVVVAAISVLIFLIIGHPDKGILGF